MSQILVSHILLGLFSTISATVSIVVGAVVVRRLVGQDATLAEQDTTLDKQSRTLARIDVRVNGRLDKALEEIARLQALALEQAEGGPLSAHARSILTTLRADVQRLDAFEAVGAMPEDATGNADEGTAPVPAPTA